MDIFSYLCLFYLRPYYNPPLLFLEKYFTLKIPIATVKNVFHLFIVSIIIHCYNIMYMEICDLDIEHYDNIFYDNQKKGGII